MNVKEELTSDSMMVPLGGTVQCSSITQRCLKSESTDESENAAECQCEECTGDAWVQGENGHLIKVKLEENEAVHHQQRETEPSGSTAVSLSLPADCLDAFFPDDPPTDNEGNPVQGPGRPTSSSSASYLCPVCGRGFTYKASCVKHQQTHLSERARPYTCATCDKSFYTRQAREKHERVHQEERPFLCAVCGKAFKDRANCVKHGKTHDPGRARPYTCDRCGAAFYTAREVKQHEAVHREKKLFRCSVCRKVFKREVRCRAHERRHDPERAKSHVCAVCGAGYQAARGLRLHEKKHRKGCK